MKDKNSAWSSARESGDLELEKVSLRGIHVDRPDFLSPILQKVQHPAPLAQIETRRFASWGISTWTSLPVSLHEE